MNREQHLAHSGHRRGLTLLEVVVVIFTLIVLAALFLPSVRIGRGVADRTRCLNNMRNVSVAIHNFASSYKSRLPAQAYYPAKSIDENGMIEIYEGHSWVVELMPYLVHTSFYDQWNFDEPWNSTLVDPVLGESNSTLADIYIPALACPEDPSAIEIKGGLSYAVNCGIGDSLWDTETGLRSLNQIPSGQHFSIEPFDWNGNGILPPDDLEDAAVTNGFTLFAPAFGREDGEPGRVFPSGSKSLGKIYDGTSNTIMLGENINAGSRPAAAKPSWADPQVASNGLVLPISARKVGPNSHAKDGSLSPLIVRKPFDPAINQSANAGEGKAPFMNSNHPGIVVVAFVDGSASTLSEDIDMSVYARLLTPAGTRAREITDFVPEATMDSDSF